MPDVHTQTPMTGNRIDTVLKELDRLRRAKYNITAYWKKRRANKRMVDQVGKGGRGGAGRHAGRKVQQVDLPDGFQVKFKIRKTGVRKGMKDRYFVAPSGIALKSKRELDAYLEDMRQARKKAQAPAASAVLPPQPPWPCARCNLEPVDTVWRPLDGTTPFDTEERICGVCWDAVRHGGVDLDLGVCWCDPYW